MTRKKTPEAEILERFGSFPGNLLNMAKHILELEKQIKGSHMTIPIPRYRCPECEDVLEEGERRCDSCNKFGARVEFLFDCPHCDTAILVDDLP